jgi:hypothetical protein
VLILPGFLANKTRAPTSQYQELRDSLLALQHPAVEVLQTNTADWLPTLSGKLARRGCDAAHGTRAHHARPQSTTVRRTTLFAGGSFLFYLQRLADAVQQLHATHKSQVCLVSCAGSTHWVCGTPQSCLHARNLPSCCVCHACITHTSTH